MKKLYEVVVYERKTFRIFAEDEEKAAEIACDEYCDLEPMDRNPKIEFGRIIPEEGYTPTEKVIAEKATQEEEERITNLLLKLISNLPDNRKNDILIQLKQQLEY